MMMNSNNIRRRRSTNWGGYSLATLAMATATSLLLPSLSTPAHALDADCQPSGAPPYSGYSLKRNTNCQSYVYCQNGIAASHMTCPGGLLFNGSVGVGGICDWASSVKCADESALNLAFDALEVHNVASVEKKEEPKKVVSPAATTSGGSNSGNTQPKSSNAADDNPNNYYCGRSAAEAAKNCIPCPTGQMTECAADFTHGCFRNVMACAASGGKSSSMSSGGGKTSGGGSGSLNDAIATSLNNNMDDIVNGFMQQTTQQTPPQGKGSQPTFQSAQPQFDSSSSTSSFTTSNTQTAPQPEPISTPSPSQSPSLPPWTNAPFNPSPTNTNSKTVIGYYASWQWYDRNKFADPKNIDFSKYDRINYAFFQPCPLGNLYGTDEWADPQLLFGPYIYDTNQHTAQNYKCSWDGPNLKNCANHDLTKGILHLAKSQGVEVMPSIGGWTLSDNFPGIAADPSKREHFAQQCIELIVAYGFDGIDLDWEYPGYEDHSGTPADTVNFTLLLKAIREKLDALGAAMTPPRFYGLTAALPCGPDKIDKIQVGEIKKYLTELNLMSYDLHGAWDALTGVNAPMFDQGWTDKSKRWSVHGCVNNYVDLGVPLSQMNIGLPFYGRSFQQATGMKSFHGGADDINYHLDEGSPQYFNIVKELSKMTTYRHENTQTQYAVFNTGDRGLVSYDDARAICDKVHYANQRGMGGFLVWEISGDMIDLGNGQMSTPLIDATNMKIQNPNFDCSTLRDPLWALSDTTYRYAPDEPDSVDWSNYIAPLSMGSANDFNGAQVNDGSVPAAASNPRPAPTPTYNDYSTPSFNAVYVSSDGGSAAKTSSGNDCPLDYTGYYPTAGCTSYVYCQKGSVVGAALPCVPTTLFDVTIGVCTWKESVKCGH